MQCEEWALTDASFLLGFVEAAYFVSSQVQMEAPLG